MKPRRSRLLNLDTKPYIIIAVAEYGNPIAALP